MNHPSNGPAPASSETINCALAAMCSGCDRLHLDRRSLEEDRRAELLRLGLGDVPTDFVWIQGGQLRDRLEFTFEPEINGGVKLGLFANDGSRTIVDIGNCPQLSPALEKWLTDLRNDLPPIHARGSVRLRVSPSGLRGAWLDFANESIRDLLNEGAWLSRWLEKGVVVEMGQKRKRVVETTEGPRAHRLVDAVLEPWFETVRRVGENDDRFTSVPLYSTIGTFTQPGFASTRALVETVLSHVKTGRASHPSASGPGGAPGDSNIVNIAEFGAGIGCFTIPLLSTGAQVDVFESDRLALAALEKGVEAAGLNSDRLTIHAGDFILSSKTAERVANAASAHEGRYDTVVVDPPRPGLGHFIEAIAGHAVGANWVYVSCYPESFAADARALSEKGLHLQRISVVEQFPFTRHFELVASFSAKNNR